MSIKSEYEIRLEALYDALEEINKIVLGLDKDAKNRDPRMVDNFQNQKEFIEKELQFVLDNLDKFSHDKTDPSIKKVLNLKWKETTKQAKQKA